MIEQPADVTDFVPVDRNERLGPVIDIPLRHRARRNVTELPEGMHRRASLTDNRIQRMGGIVRSRDVNDARVDADAGQPGQRILQKILEALGGQ